MKQFKNFLNRLETEQNDSLIESIYKGYNTVFENVASPQRLILEKAKEKFDNYKFTYDGRDYTIESYVAYQTSTGSEENLRLFASINFTHIKLDTTEKKEYLPVPHDQPDLAIQRIRRNAKISDEVKKIIKKAKTVFTRFVDHYNPLIRIENSIISTAEDSLYNLLSISVRHYYIEEYVLGEDKLEKWWEPVKKMFDKFIFISLTIPEAVKKSLDEF